MNETKIFHIYMNNNCIQHNLTEEKFFPIWETVQKIGECVPHLQFEFVELLAPERMEVASY